MRQGAWGATAAGVCVSFAFVVGVGACTGDDPQVGGSVPEGGGAETAAPAEGGADDAGNESGANDAAVDAGPCDLTQTFGAPELLSIAEAGSNNGGVRPTPRGSTSRATGTARARSDRSRTSISTSRRARRPASGRPSG